MKKKKKWKKRKEEFKEEFQIGDWVQWNTKDFDEPHMLIEAGRPYLIVDTEERYISIRLRAAGPAATGHVDMDLDEIHLAQDIYHGRK